MKTGIKIVSFIFIFLVVLTSCKKDSDTPYKVEYKVSSTSNMNVSYTDQNGAAKTATNVNSSWTYSFQTGGHGQTVRLSITSVNGSSVSGSILINGQQAAQNDNSGSTTMTAQIP